MLSIPLLRGFGLMVLVAPCYKAPKRRLFGKARTWPKLACPPMDSDPLKEAHALYDSGNILAAAMMCRVAMERELTTLAMKHPGFGEYWQGINCTADWLHARHILRKNTYESTIEAADVGNRAAHGQPVGKDEVVRMFNAVDSLRHTVRRKGGAA